MPDRSRIVSNMLGLCGAVAGGTIGYFAFFWIVNQGFYALIVPGGLLGIGCGLLARQPSHTRGLVCAVAAVALGFFTEWKFRPFNADESFTYLLQHAHQLQPVTLLMIGLGGLIAYWTSKDGDFGSRKVALPPEN